MPLLAPGSIWTSPAIRTTVPTPPAAPGCGPPIRPSARIATVVYPETLIVDRDGRIAALRRGPVDDAFLRRSVLPLLAEAA